MPRFGFAVILALSLLFCGCHTARESDKGVEANTDDLLFRVQIVYVVFPVVVQSEQGEPEIMLENKGYVKLQAHQAVEQSNIIAIGQNEKVVLKQGNGLLHTLRAGSYVLRAK
jgi:hypothetical protein